MAKTGIVTSQTQKLTTKITPQQIQIIKFIETPVAEIDALINKELEENPALDLNNSETDNSEPEVSDDNASDNEEEWKENNNSDEDMEYNRVCADELVELLEDEEITNDEFDNEIEKIIAGLQ